MNIIDILALNNKYNEGSIFETINIYEWLYLNKEYNWDIDTETMKINGVFSQKQWKWSMYCL